MKLLSMLLTAGCAEEAMQTTAPAAMPLLAKGLLVTGAGLAGVFLVLLLLLLTIKLMQKLIH